MNAILDPFLRLFKEEEPPKPSTDHAQVVLEAAATPYVKELLAWIERECHRPIAVTGDANMISAASRTNTLLEIRSKILTDIRRAEGQIEEARSER